jgi:hypothetical protein
MIQLMCHAKDDATVTVHEITDIQEKELLELGLRAEDFDDFKCYIYEIANLTLKFFK